MSQASLTAILSAELWKKLLKKNALRIKLLIQKRKKQFRQKARPKKQHTSNAAARTKGVDKTYNKQGIYSDTNSKLFESMIDKKVGDKVKDKDEDKISGKTSYQSKADTKKDEKN